MILLTLNYLLIILLATVVVYILNHLRKHARYYYLGFLIPSSSGTPMLGYGFTFIGSSLEKVTQHIIEIFDKNRDVFVAKVWLGPILLVFPTDPDMVNQILVENLHKAKFYQMMSGSSGQGLVQQMHLPKWRKHRKIVGTTFQYSALKSYIRIFFEEATILADKLSPLAIFKEPFEPHHLVGLAALNALMRNSFGVDFEIQQNHHSHFPYLEAVESSFQIFLTRICKPWLYLNFFYEISGYKSKVKNNRTIQREFIMNIMKTVRKHISQENEDKMVENSSHQSTSFVKRVLKRKINSANSLEHDMTDRELLHEMVTLLNAGFDTVTATTSFILNILAIHPTIQDEVYSEIEIVLGDPASAPTYDQLQDLNLLTRVIKEAMRLYPAAPLIGRTSPYDIECGDYTIPAGATISIFIYGIHRNPRYWPDPDRFDPDRFLPSEVAKRNPNAYIPFSLGARNCIGSKYAMLQMKTTISTLLRRYRILPGAKCRSLQDIRFEFGLTMRLLPGNDIRLEPRGLG